MPIMEIGLISFRNHAELDVKLCPGINVIWGKNGSGKTAILEAIHSLSIGKSFRTNRKKELIKTNADYFSVTGKFRNNKIFQEVQINQLKNGNRKVLIDGVKVDNIKELIGLNPVVLLSPEEQIITKGAPLDQRNYFNRLFSIISTDYLLVLLEYNQILKQRNKLLDQFNMYGNEQSELEVWDERIAECGQNIWEKRIKLFDAFNIKLQEVIDAFNDKELEFLCEFSVKIPENVEEYFNKLKQLHNKDIYLGYTTFGPHTDKINFIYGGKNIKQYGSQGEHKFALLLVKLTEVKLIRQTTGKDPIILLDDLFAKLDDNRSKQALSMIDSDLQTIITTTDLRTVEMRGINIAEKNNCSIYLE